MAVAPTPTPSYGPQQYYQMKTPLLLGSLLPTSKAMVNRGPAGTLVEQGMVTCVRRCPLKLYPPHNPHPSLILLLNFLKMDSLCLILC